MSFVTGRRGLGDAARPYLYVLPAALVLGVFFFGSFAQVVQYSLGTFNPFDRSYAFTGFENFRVLFADERFWACLLNSFLYLLVTPLIVAISLGCALIVHSGVRGAGMLRLLYFLPVVTPTIVAAIGWRILFNEDDGLLNAMAVPAVAVLNAVSGPDAAEMPRWLTERPWTLIVPMVVTLWKGFGFYMMIFLAALLTVPRELEESAALDGAGPFGRFVHVTLPSIWPTMTLVLIISSVSALKVFDEIFVTVRGVPVDHQTAVPYVYHTAFVEGVFGVSSAAAVVLFVVLLLFSMLNLWLTGGGRR